ncbi:MAG: 50S ribosomal protein L15 [Planctomycetales bacterium]|nr:50S ribosomal protein L15 [Planctomycetales bacterium]
MIINDVHRGIKKFKKGRRVGRGPGSGHGKTAARGHKGQGSRAGYSSLATFQGGAMPLVRRIPKRGFNNQFALKVAIVNLSDLEDSFASGEEVSPETLRSRNLAKGIYDELKILGEGELTKKLTVSAHRFSKSALEKIKKAGGKTVVLAPKTPVEQKKKELAAGKSKSVKSKSK